MKVIKSARTQLTFTALLATPISLLAIGQPRIVDSTPAEGSFPLVHEGAATGIFADPQEWPGVIRAARDYAADMARVGGRPVGVETNRPAGANVILVGTLGRSALIDQLVQQHKLDVSAVKGKWEATLIQVVLEPLAGVERALVIAGSDKRGTIFGLYNLSEQIGVSPWYWWADVPPRPQTALYVKPGAHLQGPPAVKYRGIFLNDEYPALGGWAQEKFGGFNHKFYTNVFELILRLRGNFLWPAMWNDSFATDDPLNARLADEYGIVMSTSHHEPMMRAWKEWGRAGNGAGTWDYSKNAEKLREFWAEGLRRNQNYEKVITLAMRGDGDEPMSEAQNIALLERIVADQRKMIAEMIHPDLSAVPQVWALYKEVQGYYERGMRVPDDVTLLWCDDNWGNIRRLPTAAERKRSGGAGVYYHFDYVGGPRNYKWINVTPLPKIWEQMHLAYHHDANRIWVVNVGDLKPMEVPIEFFLTMAWDPAAMTKEQLAGYLKQWATREFGPEHAAEIADIVARYAKYNRRRTPELLEPGTYSLEHYHEAERVLADWKAIADQAEAISAQLPADARAAFFQLVLYPAMAGYLINDLYVSVAKNRLHSSQGRASANDFAVLARARFQADADVTRAYHRDIADGKWNHMMSQTRIGYTSWQQPSSNQMPGVVEIEVPEAAGPGVAVEGTPSVWPGTTETATLLFDVFNQPRRYLDVFNKGRTPFVFKASASAPWITLETTSGKVEKQHRVWVSVDWSKAPPGSSNGVVMITGAGAEPITVNIHAFNPAAPARDAFNGFVEADGYVSIEAAHFTSKHDTPGARWEEIPDFGRTRSGMAIFPVTAASVKPPEDSPRLDYLTYLFNTGRVEVTAMLAPCVNYDPDRPVRLGVSFNDDAPQILTVVSNGYVVGDGNRDWEESVRTSARLVKSKHTMSQAGEQTLKIWMVDPGVTVEKLLVNTGGLKPSYLGPPQSHRAGFP